MDGKVTVAVASPVSTWNTEIEMREFRSWGWVLLLPTLVAVPACSDWLGKKTDDNGATTTTGSTNGVCSGTPTDCTQLGSACAETAGCTDSGSCTGNPTNPGESCTIADSASGCNATPGCYWVPVCTGSPLVSCTQVTDVACKAIIGCTWTPTAIGTTSGSCAAVACTTTSDCGCGLTCVLECNGCPAVCGYPCYSNTDCVGKTDSNGTPNLNCYEVSPGTTAPYSGICGQ